MADAVTTQILFQGTKRAIIKFTNLSDGTGESAVKKVDVSALTGAPASVQINKIWFTTTGMAVRMLWDATTDVLAFVIGADKSGHLDFSSFGGITNNAGTGVTGDLLFTTAGHTNGDSYSIILEIIKN
jgi:hypothetical protein